MGLGGLYYTGFSRWSIMGVMAGQGIAGLGLRFVQDDRWTVPNPVGLDGVFEESAAIKRGVEPYSAEFVDCLGEITQYVHDKHGKFPGTVTTLVLPGVVQAQHIDTEYYDAHFLPGAYLQTHAEHMQRWHGGDDG